MRKILAEIKLFEPRTAFSRIDLGNDGFIDKEELMDFLEDN